jgi:ABC-2 type transport system ATP-binding protein
MKPVVILKDVNKTYRDFWGRRRVIAVHSLSFSVEKGEIFGLLGPNGSGKTTTLKLILGLVFQTEGKIWLFEKEPSNVNVKQHIGFLPEESYLYPFLTAEESLRFYANFFDIPKKERNSRITDLLALVGLSDAKDRPVSEFSKGMARRLGLAQALINDPELLLLDEPTSGLDPIGTHEVKTLIKELRDKGKTIVLCSHLLADVEDVCDRIAILHKGELQTIGNMEDLLIMKDRLQITCQGVSDAAQEKIKALISDEGGEIISVQKERNRLENLFVSTIKGTSQVSETTSEGQDDHPPEDTQTPE